jgi:hypothetical protein
VNHLRQAEPSANLREALLNMDYITSLIKLEKTPLSAAICNLLVKFISFLKASVGYIVTYARLLVQPSYLFLFLQKFTDTEQLYLHHRNIYDGIIHKRIADLPLDAGSVFYLALIEMLPKITPKLSGLSCQWINPSNIEDSIVHLTLFSDSTRCSVMTPDYGLLLGESLTHPVHAGKYDLDGQKYALAARFLLDHLIKPSSKEFLFRQVVLFLFPAITEY